MTNTNLFYTGVGSRETPIWICEIMTKLATHLQTVGYVLRSGGADGADTAFENGILENESDKKTRKPWRTYYYSIYKEIYLPWKDFNYNKSPLYTIEPQAFEIAKSIHPRWDSLTQAGQKLHARNVHQVLGKDLKTPSRFVICWTEFGRKKGGTSTAILLAEKHNIPVFNIGMFDNIESVRRAYKIFADSVKI